MEKVPSLPLPLLRSILGFAVSEYAEDVLSYKRSVALSALRELKLVAKAWAVPMKEIAQQFELSMLTLTFKGDLNHDEVQQICCSVAERGEQMTELYICMDKSTDSKSTKDESIVGCNEWPQVFALLPELKLLNLDRIRLDAKHIIPVLDAAATHCPKLKSLTLPYMEREKNEQHIEDVMRKLYESLKLWRVNDNLDGLRRLKVPSRNILRLAGASKEFIDNVIVNCPQVDILDGYKASRFEAECYDIWLLTLCDWEQFNETCANLLEFNWVVAPFGDPYFRVFGENIKPQVKKLTFAVNTRWEWQWNFHDASEAVGKILYDWVRRDYCERPGYGYLATDVSAALKGCPLLDDLLIELYHPIDSDGDGGDFPEHEVINANMFGDHFCNAVATQCPFLSCFTIDEVDEDVNSTDFKPIETRMSIQQTLSLLKRSQIEGSWRLVASNFCKI